MVVCFSMPTKCNGCSGWNPYRKTTRPASSFPCHSAPTAITISPMAVSSSLRIHFEWTEAFNELRITKIINTYRNQTHCSWLFLFHCSCSSFIEHISFPFSIITYLLHSVSKHWFLLNSANVDLIPQSYSETAEGTTRRSESKQSIPVV